MNTENIVSKGWSFCNILRDDGVSYGDYLEQLTYLIFLKMADEYSQPPYNRKMNIPVKYDWKSLVKKRGAELEAHYIKLLQKLSTQGGLLSEIFVKSQNKIQDPAKLYKLIQMINEENWALLGADVKGNIKDLTYNRQDFWATTSNKQLNFI